MVVMGSRALPTPPPAHPRAVPADRGMAPYLRDIGAHPLLTREEERELGERMAAGDEAARTRLVVCNLRLVVDVVKRYRTRGLSFTDLVQEGNMGLMRAAEKYDYTRGYRFSTCAVWWIRDAITHAIKEQGTTIQGASVSLPSGRARGLPGARTRARSSRSTRPATTTTMATTTTGGDRGSGRPSRRG